MEKIVMLVDVFFNVDLLGASLVLSPKSIWSSIFVRSFLTSRKSTGGFSSGGLKSSVKSLVVYSF